MSCIRNIKVSKRYSCLPGLQRADLQSATNGNIAQYRNICIYLSVVGIVIQPVRRLMKLHHTLGLSILLVPLLFESLTAKSQGTKGENPIIFTDALIGHSYGKSGGLSGGLSLNYQISRSLFTFRILGTVKLESSFASPFLPIPVFMQKSSMEEYALIYGWRFIDANRAFSFSLGPSYNVFSESKSDVNNQQFKSLSRYAGASFEANIKWFKKEKRRFRIYGLFPIGKPTGFGSSAGFKIFGNISKETYAGMGIIFGYGFHKVY